MARSIVLCTPTSPRLHEWYAHHYCPEFSCRFILFPGHKEDQANERGGGDLSDRVPRDYGKTLDALIFSRLSWIVAF